MKVHFTKVLFFIAVFLGIILLITRLIIYSELNFTFKLNNILTPFVTLITGIILFLTFWENIKTNKHFISAKSFEDLSTELRDCIDLDLVNKNFTDENGLCMQEIINGEHNYSSYIGKLMQSKPKEWFDNLIIAIKTIRNNNDFEELFIPSDLGLLRERDFDQFSNFTLYQFIDSDIWAVINHFKFFQDHLLNLITGEYQEFNTLDRAKLIRIITRETGYNEFLFEIDRFFEERDGQILSIATQHDPKYNTKIYVKEFENDKYILKERYLIQWELFAGLYEKHKLIVNASESIAQRIKTWDKIKKIFIL